MDLTGNKLEKFQKLHCRYTNNRDSRKCHQSHFKLVLCLNGRVFCVNTTPRVENNKHYIVLNLSTI